MSRAAVTGTPSSTGTSQSPGPVQRLGWRRVVAVMSVAALVSAVCVLAGMWQWSRHTDRSAQVALVRENLSAPTADVTEVVEADGALPAAAVWRHAEVQGRYVGEPVLLRNRPIGGGPGYHVLGVVQVDDPPHTGRLLVVDRGFLAGELDAAADLKVPAPPSGPVGLEIRVRADEPESARSAPDGQVQGIHVRQVVEAAGLASTPADGAPLPWYGIVRAEDGAPPAGLVPLPSPTTDLGSHLSYTFQWWIFALGALVGGVVLLRREAAADAELAEDDAARTDTSGATRHGTARPGPSSLRRRPRPTAGTRRRRPTAEEEEDALLDAQSAER